MNNSYNLIDILICIIFISIFILLVFSLFDGNSIKKTKSKSLSPFGYYLFYTDQKELIKKENVIYSKLLFSEKYNLVGKPDYVYKKGKKFFPVELKSGTIGNSLIPHDGDFLQLIAYFLILEDVYGAKIKKGKLIYSDYSFIIKNTRKNKKLLLKTVKNMRTMLKTGKGTPVCNFSHCKFCICKETVCEYYKK